MSPHQALIKSLTAMPKAQCMAMATAACSVASGVCCLIYDARFHSGTPGTWNSSLWGEATQSYLKFQNCDPMSYPARK